MNSWKKLMRSVVLAALSVAIVLSSGFGVSSVSANTVLIDETFDSTASSFTVVSGGTWSVSVGQYVLSNPAAAPTPSSPNANVSVHDTPVNGDFVLNTEASVTDTSSSWNDISIIYNFQDASNYYMVSLNESNDAYTSGILKVESGVKSELADITTMITADTMMEIEIVKTGSQVEVSLDGVVVAQTTDSTFTGGKVGYGSNNDGGTFDNLLVSDSPASSPKLTWAPPTLTNPITINVTNADRSIQMNQNQDYIIQLSEKLTGQLNLYGGNDVVLIGGHIEVPWAGDFEDLDSIGSRRGMYVQNWTGTLHIEGVLINGPDLAEGINVDTRTEGAILQLQNVRVEDVHGRPEEAACYTCQGVHHPDIIQNWGGPTYYRIDRFTGSTDYQGFMMQPTKYGDPTLLADFRNMNLSGTDGYLIYRTTTGTDDYNLDNVWLYKSNGHKYAYKESDPEWNALNFGLPPGGDFVPAGVAGMNYVSPGYN